MLKQGLYQKMLQKLSPQQIQLMKLLQVPTAELEQRIKEEMEMNPALEEGKEENEDELVFADDPQENTEEVQSEAEKMNDEIDVSEYIQDEDIPYYKTSSNNSSADDEHTVIPISAGKSFQENLIAQLGLASLGDVKTEIAKQIIGSIDDDGYLRRELHSVSDDLMFSKNVRTTEKEIEEVLELIQTFEPAGVGARDLQECLLIQLQRIENDNDEVKTAIKIIKNHMNEFSKKHYSKLEKAYNLNDEELKAVIGHILKLNPKPGNSMSDSHRLVQHIVPDFILNNNDGNLELSLNARNVPDLKVSRSYQEMLKTYSKGKTKDKSTKEAVQFVKQKLDSAKWFIDAIKQRQETLMNTMSAIINYQYQYFLDGDEKLLKPMILKDIAEMVNLDISTISRVANSKYIQTPFGTFLLKSFFSESLSTDSGEEVSSREVKNILQECVDNEDKRKPLPDDRLAKILNDKGYNIARRTVAKYREQLNIPVARLRKQL
ncbi:MAG: RNA polymerase factor sigma-54 [Bacteroidia bacterium]|nr:RNA polymerase factor sigma-54 [Bacteroidia bacterium]NNC85596.1 RNA polymerase factor sigma-54 [Bacteroidia bacterium]NNM15395.1 RNA polymerase factor sigma-54 [Bacteroidia bacterium]